MVDRTSNVKSLAAVRPGETVVIRDVLFEDLRGYCSDLGIRPDEPLQCRSGPAARLVLETAAGRTVLFDRDLARFIEVASMDGGSVASIGSGEHRGR